MYTQKNALRYIAEFFVIVTGITASFWGEEYRESLQNDKEEIKALKNLQTELNDIDTYCEERKISYVKDRNVLKYLLDNSDYAFDSIDNLV